MINKFYTLLIFAFVAFYIAQMLLEFYYALKKFYIKHTTPIILLPEDKQFLENHVDFYKNLSSKEKNVFEDKIKIFLKNYEIIGVDIKITPQDKLLVAASGTIPVFRFKTWYYPNLHKIYLFDDSFSYLGPGVPKDTKVNGLVGKGFLGGKMYLSRKALYNGFKKINKGKNTGIHEFLHLIDMEDGTMDGIPETLLGKYSYKPWLNLIENEIQRICNETTILSDYACSNATEFFAETGVHFFEKPEELKKNHPQLYDLLYQIFMTK